MINLYKHQICGCETGLVIHVNHLDYVWPCCLLFKIKIHSDDECLVAAQALERMMSPVGPSPNPNVPSEYCSTIPPLQQARAAGTLNSPPPTVMVPVSVLKHPNHDGMATLGEKRKSLLSPLSPNENFDRSLSSGCPREQKRVWFADGILPNGEVADTTRLSVSSRRGSQEIGGVTSDQTAVRNQNIQFSFHHVAAAAAASFAATTWFNVLAVQQT